MQKKRTARRRIINLIEVLSLAPGAPWFRMEKEQKETPLPGLESEEIWGFEVALQSCFATWAPLLLAVENSFGGPQSRDKAKKLFEDYLNFFYSTPTLNSRPPRPSP